MARNTRKWLMIGAVLMAFGLITWAVVMAACDWDVKRLSTVTYETVSHPVETDIQHIMVDVDTSDIRFVPSETDACTVVCYEQAYITHRVSADNGTLVIRTEDQRKWYEKMEIGLEQTCVTVYLPIGTYGALRIHSGTGAIEIPREFVFENVEITTSTGDIACAAPATANMKMSASTGDIRLEQVTAGSLEVSVSTGQVYLSRVQCAGEASVTVSTGKTVMTDTVLGSLVSAGSTGDIQLIHTVASGSVSIQRSTGDVTLEECDAAELFIKTSTGDVRGTLLTGKNFAARTDTGRVAVPADSSGGICEIVTDTGDIRLNAVD